MTQRKWLYLTWALPVCFGIWVVAMGWVSKQKGKQILIPAEALRKSEKVWSDFRYVPIADQCLLEEELSRLITFNAQLDEHQREITSELIRDILLGYGLPNWERFARFRLPYGAYNVSGERAQDLRDVASKLGSSAGTAIEQYREIWRHTFDRPLWSEVAFFDASLSLFTAKKTTDLQLELPDFVAKTNQNWLGASLSSTFDYSADLQRLFNSGTDVQVMRLSFLGGLDLGQTQERRPFMFTFYWNPQIQKWIPWHFGQYFVRSPSHTIRFF